MSYVTKSINNVNKQVTDHVEQSLLDFNIQALKKVMTSFTRFDDEYLASLDDSEDVV